MKKVKIIIPANPTLLVALAMKILGKHTSLGAASPLNGVDWTLNTPIINNAASLDVEAADLHRQGEKKTEERDALIPALSEFVRGSRDVLLGLNRSNPRVLSDYGFVVNDSVPAPKPATVTPPPTP